MFVLLFLRPASLTRPLRRTCPSLPWRSTTGTKNTGTQRRAEVCVGFKAGGDAVKTAVALRRAGDNAVLSPLSCSHEELHQHGLLRQQENPPQAEEVPDPPADPAGRPRQGLHQRCWDGVPVSPPRHRPHLTPPPPAFSTSRSGVRLQPVRPVPQGERHGARLRQDVRRPRGEQLWVLVKRRRTPVLLVSAHRCHSAVPSAPAGLCVDGLYRVSGNLAVIQKLRYAVDHGESPPVQSPPAPARVPG